MPQDDRTLKEHLESGAKYSATALTLSAAIVGIILFFRPDYEPIGVYMNTLFAFILNLLMIYVVKKS